MSRAEVRAVDQIAIEKFGVPGIVLMENAGRGAAECLLSLGVTGRVVICCGKGNNGGDGFVVARHLENHGCDVRVLFCCDPGLVTGDAAINLRILQAAGTLLSVIESPALAAELSHAEWIVDALLGTGISGQLREPFPQIIDDINASSAKVFAVDLPSGMDCDTGEAWGCCVRANHTATFVARKLGFENHKSQPLTGEVTVIDIGVPKVILDEV